MTAGRLRNSLIGYAVLGAVGVATLDGDIRLVLLVFLGGLAVKSYIAFLRTRAEEGGDPQREKDRDHPSRP